MSGSERWIIIVVGLVAVAAVVGIVFFGMDLLSPPEPVEVPRADRDGRAEAGRDTDDLEFDEPSRPRRVERREPDPRTEPEEAPRVGWVTGRCVDQNRRPVGGAYIALHRSSMGADLEDGELLADETTADDGTFALEVPPGKSYGIVGKLEGFADTKMIGIAVVEGETTSVRDLRFVVGSTLSGHVYSENGGGIEGARVLAVLQPKLGAGIDRTPGPSATTDASGYYEIRNIPPGIKNVFAGAQGYATRMVRDVTIDEGEDVSGVDITLSEGKAIEGVVLDLETSLPIAGARVTAQPTVFDDPVRSEATTDETGAFRLTGLATFGYRVQVRAKGYVPSGYQVLQHGMPPAEFFLARNGGIRGRVFSDSGEAIDAPITIRYGNALGEREPNAKEVGIQGIGQRITAEADGSFEIYDLNPGRWILEAWADGYSYVRSETIDLQKGQWVDGVVLSLGRGGEIRGRVTAAIDGASIEGAKVSVFPDDGRPPFILQSVSDAYVRTGYTAGDGTFVVDGLGPGKKKIEVDHGDFSKAEKSGIEMRGSGDSLDVGEISLFAGATVEGSIRANDGRVVPRAQILIEKTGGGWRRRVKSDEQGLFRFDKVPEGAYTVRVEIVKGPLRKEVRASDYRMQTLRVGEGDRVEIVF